MRRRDFIESLTEHPTYLYNVVYRDSQKAEWKKPPRYIRVDFDLEWPADSVKSTQEFEISQLAVGDALYRVKSLLSRSMLADVMLFDITIGCLSVRYIPPRSAEPDLVRASIRKLWLHRDAYFVTHVSAHFDGRALLAI
jgi:hypothetical protein